MRDVIPDLAATKAAIYNRAGKRVLEMLKAHTITGLLVNEHGNSIFQARPPVRNLHPPPDHACNMVKAVKAQAERKIRQGRDEDDASAWIAFQPVPHG